MKINKEIMDSIMNEGKIVGEEHTTTADGIKVDCWVFMNVEA